MVSDEDAVNMETMMQNALTFSEMHYFTSGAAIFFIIGWILSRVFLGLGL